MLAVGAQLLVAYVLIARFDEIGVIGAAPLVLELALAAVWSWQCVRPNTL
jgi:hypothetical protein